MTLASRVESGFMDDRLSSVAKLIACFDPQAVRTHIRKRPWLLDTHDVGAYSTFLDG